MMFIYNLYIMLVCLEKKRKNRRKKEQKKGREGGKEK